jgi:xanthosine utilization system XapX-like protein
MAEKSGVEETEMADGDESAALVPAVTADEGINVTPDFQMAVADAVKLFDYAASNGLLPMTGSDDMRGLIQPLLRANGATQLSLQRVTDFWIAYASLTHLVWPITAASLAASSKISLLGLKSRATSVVALVIVFSIYLFAGTTTVEKTHNLIEKQNGAALQLWSDLQALRVTKLNTETKAEDDRPTAALNERVFRAVVEFSRQSAALLQSAERLRWFTLWLATSVPERLRDSAAPESPLAPVQMAEDGSVVPRVESGNPDASKRPAAPVRQPTLRGLNVQPDLLTFALPIQDEAVVQIKLYQTIRDYALNLVDIMGLVSNSLSTYILPSIYALLGTFLYGLRFNSAQIDRREYVASAAHGTRYFIAAIGGLVVGAFGSLFNLGPAAPPLMVAFLVGYAVDAFFVRLDALISRLNAASAPGQRGDTAAVPGRDALKGAAAPGPS